MLRAGILDSGGPDGAEAMGFDADGLCCPALPDRLGHGSAVAGTIARACPGTRLIHAQVFGDRPVTSPLRVAAALDWLRAEAGADLVCLSLGLSADRAVLAAAVARAREAGLVLVAAHPARGPGCWPARYRGVIAATGDARCGPGEISRLGRELFGAFCNSPEHGGRGMGGASLGAAAVAGHVARLLTDGTPGTAEAICAELAAAACHQGPERRRA